MLSDAALGIVNHLLTSEGWASDRLKSFAGKRFRLEQGVLKLTLEITASGCLDSADERDPVDVCFTLPADAPKRVLTDRPSLYTATQINGSAELAETLGFVFRNLRWDAERDLSHLVGDIAAHRVVEGSKLLFKWHQQQAKNLALNFAEYLTEESPTITPRREIAGFCSEVELLRRTLEVVEKRIDSLEKLQP